MTNRPTTSQKKRLFFQQQKQEQSQPLWKKIVDNERKEQSNLEQEIHNQVKKQHKKSENNNINQFLHKLHLKIAESINQNQSQTVQKLNIDWDDNNLNKTSMRLLAKALSLSQNPIYSSRDLKDSNSMILLNKLCEIQTLQQLLTFMLQYNLPLHAKVKSVTQQNKQLAAQNQRLKEEKQKDTKKIMYLSSKLKILDKKNEKLVADFQIMKKEVDLQVHIQEERLKYKYQSIIHDIKLQNDNKMQKFKLQEITCASLKYQSNSGTDRPKKSNQSYIKSQTQRYESQQSMGDASRIHKNQNLKNMKMSHQRVRSCIDKNNSSQQQKVMKPRQNHKFNKSLKLPQTCER